MPPVPHNTPHNYMAPPCTYMHVMLSSGPCATKSYLLLTPAACISRSVMLKEQGSTGRHVLFHSGWLQRRDGHTAVRPDSKANLARPRSII